MTLPYGNDRTVGCYFPVQVLRTQSVHAIVCHHGMVSEEQDDAKRLWESYPGKAPYLSESCSSKPSFVHRIYSKLRSIRIRVGRIIA